MFSRIRASYQTILEELLQKDSSTDAALQAFQARNSLGLFLCRFHDCPRAEQGFDSIEARQQHEDSHSPRFQCTIATCGFFGWTFKSRARLKQHVDLYHDEQKTSAIPSSLGANHIRNPISSIEKLPNDLSNYGLPTSEQIFPNRVLEEHQMQLMLLEDQSKKRLLMARQEQKENRLKPTVTSSFPFPSFETLEW